MDTTTPDVAAPPERPLTPSELATLRRRAFHAAAMGEDADE